jgi:asparaginyl-tRNA synthetase
MEQLRLERLVSLRTGNEVKQLKELEKGPAPGKATGGAPSSPPRAAPAPVPGASSRDWRGEAYSSAVGGRVRIAHVLHNYKALIGQTITVCGWVKSKRDQVKFNFVELNDGSCQRSLQVVVDAGAKGFESLKPINTGGCMKFIGKLIESPAKGQDVELQIQEGVGEVIVLGGVDTATYPLAKAKLSPEYLRSIAHLRPRTNLVGGVMRVRSALGYAIHKFFQDRGFTYVHTPLMTGADCEGAGEMFQVTTLLNAGEAKVAELPKAADGKVDYTKDFFGKPVFLTVSGQLAVENFACAMSDVYTFGPTFRAENSNTSRHLAEFWMIEPELAFADINDDMACAEDFLKFCARYVYDNLRDDLDFFDLRVEKGLVQRVEKLINEPFARITYTEAIEILKAQEKKKKFEAGKVEWGMDLPSEMERFLAEIHFKKPVIVYNYPKGIKAFYMRLNEDNETVAAMDVLVPGVGEVIGGSQREERYEILEQKIKDGGMEPNDYRWYLDLRRYGTVPHSGFGLGLERLIMLVTGVSNIRDVIPYPRYPGHAEF